jgi:hypothetical protein
MVTPRRSARRARSPDPDSFEVMKYYIVPLFALSLVPLAGCGDGGAALVKVSGTITHNGKPYANALVEFMPDRSNPIATIGTDTTGPEGNYLIKSSSGRTGLAAGKYSVKVSPAPASSSLDAAADQAPTPENDPGQLAAASAAFTKKAAPKVEGASGSFTGEVAPSGSILDYDLKGGTKAPPK